MIKLSILRTEMRYAFHYILSITRLKHVDSAALSTIPAKQQLTPLLSLSFSFPPLKTSRAEILDISIEPTVSSAQACANDIITP